VFGIATGRASLVGLAVGAGLGVRVSWAPLFVPMLALAPAGVRLRAAGSVAVGILAWAVPLALIVGPAHLVVVSRAHLGGHMTRWGGTALTASAPRARPLLLTRDLLVDGLGGGTDLLGLAILALALALGVYGTVAWQRAGWKGARAAVLVLLPYLAWIAFGQNLSAQPRHALPIVVALAAALSLAATTGRRAFALGLALLALVLARTGGLAYLRRTIPPPGAQLVEFARGLPRPEKIAVFGGPSARFFALAGAGGGARGQTVGSLGDALLALGRANEMPERALVTSELAGLGESSFPLVHMATLCRPPRLDRRAPCLEIYDLRAPFLSHQTP
jgi:hypothetical protein